ncbi:MAG: methyltransferase [Candidatus Binataceae bacterium]
MKLVFLGTRGYIEARNRYHRRHSSLLISFNGRRIMVDGGEDWLRSIGHVRPHAILVTHAHPDHCGGLRVACPMYATAAAWSGMSAYKIEQRHTIETRNPFAVQGVGFEAFPVIHSFRAPAVGYRITAGPAAIFYVPDVIDINDRALREIKVKAGWSCPREGSSMASRPRSPLLLVPPPILYAAFFGAGLLLNPLVPWSPSWMQTDLARSIGWVLVVPAAMLGLASLALFLLKRTTVIPHGNPAQLVADGPFAISRNPMYVALTATYCGGAILADRAWPLIFLVAPILVMQLVVIPFEEQHMSEAFGKAYADYCRRVRRWL